MKIPATLLALALALASSTHAAPSGTFTTQELKKYIVTLKPGANAPQFSAALHAATANAPEAQGSKVHKAFSIGEDFVAYTGAFSPAFAEKLKSSPHVAAVEEDAPVHALGSQSNPPSWGLTRIGQRQNKPGAPYVFPDTAGAGVDVYVVDTGIDIQHPDFEGRATFDFVSDSSWSKADENGHGTHVAGTIAGKTFGVAKKAHVHAVRVLGPDGSGTNSGVISGINYVSQQAKQKKTTVIANMSLGGGKSTAVNAAVAAATKAGVVFAVAAGNESQDACNTSPASEPSALTVGAIRQGDEFEDQYSNFGKCVKVLAPGTDIVSDWNNGKTNTISGTSMATPHVAGAAALRLAANKKQTPAQVIAAVINSATSGAISGVPSKTPNKLVYVN